MSYLSVFRAVTFTPWQPVRQFLGACFSWLFRPRGWSFLALLLLFLWRIFDIVIGGNFHAVRPGACYRGAQPSADSLEKIAREHHIRTVINMRGFQDKPWFHQENQVASALGIKLVHIGMWSSLPPEVPEFRNLIRSLADDPGPFFLHCHTGSDRTGLGSALFLLLRTDATLEEARQQLGLYFGHVHWGRASCQGLLLDRYGLWLRQQDLRHTPTLLRKWGLEVYDGTLGSGKAAPVSRPSARTTNQDRRRGPNHLQPASAANVAANSPSAT